MICPIYFRSSQPIYSMADKIQEGLRGQSWLQDKGKYIRFAPNQQKAVAWSGVFVLVFRILKTLHAHNPSNRFYSLYHQHNPSFCLSKHLTSSSSSSLGKIQASLILLSLVRRFRIATNYRINLIGCNRLPIFTDM